MTKDQDFIRRFHNNSLNRIMQKGGSIVDYLKGIGEDSSRSTRKRLAMERGLKGDLSAADNLALLESLQNNESSRPGTLSQDREFATQAGNKIADVFGRATGTPVVTTPVSTVQNIQSRTRPIVNNSVAAVTRPTRPKSSVVTAPITAASSGYSYPTPVNYTRGQNYAEAPISVQGNDADVRQLQNASGIDPNYANTVYGRNPYMPNGVQRSMSEVEIERKKEEFRKKKQAAIDAANPTWRGIKGIYNSIDNYIKTDHSR